MICIRLAGGQTSDADDLNTLAPESCGLMHYKCTALWTFASSMSVTPVATTISIPCAMTVQATAAQLDFAEHGVCS